MFPATAALLLCLLGSEPPNAPKPASAKEALQPFNLLVGSWRGTGYPEGGTKDERAAGLWTETITWAWQFKGDDAHLVATFDKGKHFTRGELAYAVGKGTYQFVVTAVDKTTLTFTGTLKDKVLTLDRADAPKGRDERLVISLLHHNRYLYRLDTRAGGSALGYVKTFQVGATKAGVPFAEVAKGPECVVTGGVGTMTVSYKGMSYPVCCTGCRDEFKADPEKYIKEAAKRAKDGK